MNSVEKYDFDIVEVIKTSFKMTDGFKATFWAMSFLFGIAFLILFFLLSFILVPGFSVNTMSTPEFAEKSQYVVFILLPLVALSTTILEMTSLAHTRGEDVSVGSLNYYTKFFWRLTIVIFVITLFKYAIDEIALASGIDWLSVVASIITFIATILFYFSYMLIADKDVGAIESLKLSFFGVIHNFWKIALVFIFFYGISFASNLLLGSEFIASMPLMGFVFSLVFMIVVIWFLPAMFIGTSGLLYRIIFDGVELDSSR